MKAPRLWLYPTLLAGLFIACGDKGVSDPDPDPCPKGTESCRCLDDFSCSGTLVCQQGKCFAFGSTTSDTSGNTTGTTASGGRATTTGMTTEMTTDGGGLGGGGMGGMSVQ
jgi:hypothetical protein